MICVYILFVSIYLTSPQKQAAFLLSIIGISNTSGRVVSGWMSDFYCVDSLTVVNISLVLSAVSGKPPPSL